MSNPWNAVAFSKDLKRKPIRVFYQKTPVVLFRDRLSVCAIRDQCPHRGAPLSLGIVSDGKIACPYHGWTFNGNGEQLAQPGNCHFKPSNKSIIKTYQALEKDGVLFLRSDSANTVNDVFIPQVHHSHSYFSVSVSIDADIIDVFENFLDPLHTHFVHAKIIRSDTQERHICHVGIKNIEQGYQATYIEEEKQSGLFSGLFGQNITKSIGRVRSQNVVEIEYYSKKTLELSVVIYANQETNDRCKLLIRTYLKKQKIPFWVAAPVLYVFQLITFVQDRKVLETIHREKQSTGTFSPLITRTDIMRPYIEKALDNQFIAVDEQLEILL